MNKVEFIKVLDNKIKIEKMDYDMALYIINLEHPIISESEKKQYAKESYIVYTSVGNDIMYYLCENSSKLYYPISKYRFYKQCKSYNEYNINFNINHLVHSLNQYGAEKIYDEIFEVNDGEELYVLSNFIKNICHFGIANGVEILARIVKYFKIDYQNPEWKEVLIEISNYNFETEKTNTKKWYDKAILLNMIIYRMFLEYDKEYRFPIFPFFTGEESSRDIFAECPKDKKNVYRKLKNYE